MAMIMFLVLSFLAIFSLAGLGITLEPGYSKKWRLFWACLLLFSSGYTISAFAMRSEFVGQGYANGYKEGQLTAFKGQQMYIKTVTVSTDTSTSYVIDSAKLNQLLPKK